MDFYNERQRLETAANSIETSAEAINLPKLEEELHALEKEREGENFWTDVEKAKNVNMRIAAIERKIASVAKLRKKAADLKELIDMAEGEEDEALRTEITDIETELEKEAEALFLESLMNGKYDPLNAILTLHAGAGGTEAQDWADMLYRMYRRYAERKGYSGVAIYTKQEPDKIEKMDIEEFDKEGRALFLTFGKRVLISAYFPNSQEGGKRLGYKLRFCEAMKQKLDELTASGFEVILCGDYNIAPFPIDLKNPKSNENNPGYLPEERAWMKQFLDAGYIDCFRFFYPEKTDAYTWWSYRFQARSKNIGWRIDFFCVNLILKEKLKACEILSEITGSDHCPIMLEIAD